MSEPSDLPISSLRRLARGLLYDDARAEDVVQEAWLAALRRGPPPEGLRAWLAEAVRRIARSAGRDELRRAAREQRAARPEALPSAAEASARIEILRRLLDAVDSLDEPCRSAVVLRYFDELPPRVIAKRLGVPVNTARTHVRRGLERLRRQLGGEHGRGREELLAALVPFAGSPPWSGLLGGRPRGSLAPAEIGALLMKSPIVIASTVALCAGAWWFLRDEESRAGDPPVVARSAANAAEVDRARSSDPDRRAQPELEDAAATGSRERVNDAPVAVAAAWAVRGHLFRGLREPFPHGELVGRIYAGPELEGTPILVERFRADEHGDYAWSIAPPTELVAIQVETAPEGQLSTDWTYDVFQPGDAPPERWDLSAYPLDGVLRGVVRDPRGAPVPGARVVHERFATVKEVRCDAEGRYEVPTSSARGFVELTVLAAGFAVSSSHLEELPAGEHAHDVTLEPELRLAGRVIDQHGARVEGAYVSVTFPPELVGVRTSADGRFELGQVARGLQGFGDQVTVSVEKAGFLMLRQGVVHSPSEEVELVLKRGVPISGRVLAPDRSPVEGCQVSVGYGTYPSNITYTDAEGRFALAPTWPGECELWLWRRGFAQRRHDIEIPAGAASVDGIEIVLAEPHSLGGVVLDPAGEPVPRAWVFIEDADSENERVQDFSTHADAEGRFFFEGLPDVPMLVCVREAGCAPLEQNVVALDRDDLVLRLTASAGLAGRALDGVTGLPIPSFTIRIARTEGSFTSTSLPEAGRTFTDPAGVWRTDEQMAAGRVFTIEVRAPGYAATTARVVSSLERDPARCVARLKPGARVRGRVVERATQQPVAGARVTHASVLDRSGLSLTPLTTRTDARGNFELADVPPGGMALRVEAAEGGAVDGPFQVAEGETIERWVELHAGGSLEGRLLDANGVGIGGASVQLIGTHVVGSNRWRTATTATDGSYSFADLPPGIFEISWMREMEGQRTSDLQRLVVLQEGVNRLDLRPRGATTLRGTVTQEDGSARPVAALYVYQRGRNLPGFNDGTRGAFAVNGSFEVLGLEAGSWTVAAYRHSAGGKSITGHTTVEVPGEGTVEAHVVMQAPR